MKEGAKKRGNEREKERKAVGNVDNEKMEHHCVRVIIS
jgi:hypothetical protein